MSSSDYEKRKVNAIRWLEAFKRPIGVGCIIPNEDEYKRYLGVVYSILMRIQEENEHIKKINAWRSFWNFKPKNRYTIYDRIGDMHYDHSYTNSLSELCVILKLCYDVKNENYIEPIVLRGDPRFGNGYTYDDYIKDGEMLKLQGEILAAMILADARRIDFYGRNYDNPFDSSIAYNKLSHSQILEKYKSEIDSRCKEPLPNEICLGRGEQMSIDIEENNNKKTAIKSVSVSIWTVNEEFYRENDEGCGEWYKEDIALSENDYEILTAFIEDHTANGNKPEDFRVYKWSDELSEWLGEKVIADIRTKYKDYKERIYKFRVSSEWIEDYISWQGIIKGIRVWEKEREGVWNIYYPKIKLYQDYNTFSRAVDAYKNQCSKAQKESQSFNMFLQEYDSDLYGTICGKVSDYLHIYHDFHMWVDERYGFIINMDKQ